MDVVKLKKHIIENDLIEEILDKCEYAGITDRGNEIRCAKEDGSNPTSIRIYKDTLKSFCFSSNLNGDLITLVQNKFDLTFPQALKRISDIIDFKPIKEEAIETYEPFGGFYKKIARLKKDEPLDLDIYSDDILQQYANLPNLLFYKDNILPSVQMQYNIGYDSVTNRITVPWRTESGICGVMGRLNKQEVDEGEMKWYPIHAFPKSKVLYGFVENYNSIQEKRIVMVSESEKGTLQNSSKGLNVGVSLGGSNMSEHQANMIKSLYPKTILILLDEGLDESISRDMAERLKFHRFFKNKVGYIYDKNNLYMPKDSKLAPSDLDKNTLNTLIKNCTVWV